MDYEALNDSAIAGEVSLIVPTLPASTTVTTAASSARVTASSAGDGDVEGTMMSVVGHPRSENEAGISLDQQQPPQISNNGGRKTKDDRQRISNRQKLLLLKRHHSGLVVHFFFFYLMAGCPWKF